MRTPLKNIATHVITGFLGTGKTTAILNLLRYKPSNEHWSVLVNESGKTGVDGILIEHAGITVKQVPGGCMCCSSGVPMQIAVNRLLQESRPHRLIIEPSGMGHPGNILGILGSAEYDGVLDMHACICLVDPRNLSEQRYLNSELFMDQISIADILIANKTDLCTEHDRLRFDEFVAALPAALQATDWVKQGVISSAWLNLPHQAADSRMFKRLQQHSTELASYSFSFPDEVIFRQECLLRVIHQAKIERAKAIIRTESGVMSINSVREETTITPIGIVKGFLLEIVALPGLDEAQLLEQIYSCKL